jgi:hypothetical protein
LSCHSGQSYSGGRQISARRNAPHRDRSMPYIVTGCFHSLGRTTLIGSGILAGTTRRWIRYFLLFEQRALVSTREAHKRYQHNMWTLRCVYSVMFACSHYPCFSAVRAHLMVVIEQRYISQPQRQPQRHLQYSYAFSHSPSSPLPRLDLR